MNYKRKSRRRFFLLMRSRTPPISSEFRGGGGFEPPKPPPLGTPLDQPTSCCTSTGVSSLQGRLSGTHPPSVEVRNEWNEDSCSPLRVFMAVTGTDVSLYRSEDSVVLPPLPPPQASVTHQNIADPNAVWWHRWQTQNFSLYLRSYVDAEKLTKNLTLNESRTFVAVAGFTVYRQVTALINTLRTGSFKLFKCTFPGSIQFKSTFLLCFFKYL